LLRADGEKSEAARTRGYRKFLWHFWGGGGLGLVEVKLRRANNQAIEETTIRDDSAKVSSRVPPGFATRERACHL
jgi:hypothetical protein